MQESNIMIDPSLMLAENSIKNTFDLLNLFSKEHKVLDFTSKKV